MHMNTGESFRGTVPNLPQQATPSFADKPLSLPRHVIIPETVLTKKFSCAEAIKISASSGPAHVMGTRLKYESYSDAATTMLVIKEELCT